MFKGTARRTADGCEPRVRRNGGPLQRLHQRGKHRLLRRPCCPNSNRGPSSCWATFCGPALREEDFTTEKQVILEEIKMYEDQPPFGADDKCRAAHFAGHPLGKSVLGTVESVGSLPVEKMRQYFAHRYSPQNIVLAAAGRIDFDALAATAQQVCGGWERFERTARREAGRPRDSGFDLIHKPTATQQYLLQMCDGPSATDDDRFAAKLLTTMLGDDSGSRLYWELVDPGLAENCQPASLRIRRRRRVSDVHVLRSRKTQPKISACCSTVYRKAEAGRLHRGRTIASQEQNFTPASCLAANARAAGCFPSARTGRTAERIAA